MWGCRRGGVRGAGAKRAPTRPLQRCEDSALVAEAHLALRRVHVHVNSGRVDVEARDPEGVTTRWDEAAIRFVDGELQRSMLNATSVDHEDQSGAGGSMCMRPADRSSVGYVSAHSPFDKVRRRPRAEEGTRCPSQHAAWRPGT